MKTNPTPAHLPAATLLLPAFAVDLTPIAEQGYSFYVRYPPVR
jgi:hypothetical protein